jgi:hypothetical protein
VFDCGFCCLVLFLLLLRFDLFLLVDDVDGFESIVAVVEAAVAVDDGLDAFCVFLLRFTMNSADDDDID